MKEYIVDIELDAVEIRVTAKNKTEAKKKALKRLKRRSIVGLIKKHWPSNRRCIDAEEI